MEIPFWKKSDIEKDFHRILPQFRLDELMSWIRGYLGYSVIYSVAIYLQGELFLCYSSENTYVFVNVVHLVRIARPCMEFVTRIDVDLMVSAVICQTISSNVSVMMVISDNSAKKRLTHVLSNPAKTMQYVFQAKMGISRASA